MVQAALNKGYVRQNEGFIRAYSDEEYRTMLAAAPASPVVPVAMKREQQISKAAQLIFEAYNMPRDRYPDDYRYSLFLSGKVREAHGVMQCVRGVATWSADNCAPASQAVSSADSLPAETVDRRWHSIGS